MGCRLIPVDIALLVLALDGDTESPLEVVVMMLKGVVELQLKSAVVVLETTVGLAVVVTGSGDEAAMK